MWQTLYAKCLSWATWAQTCSLRKWRAAEGTEHHIIVNDQNDQNAYSSFKTNMIMLLHCSTFRHYTCFHTPPQHSPQCVSSICPVPPSSSIQVCRPSSQTESNHLNCKYIWYPVAKLVSSGLLVPNVHFNLNLFFHPVQASAQCILNSTRQLYPPDRFYFGICGVTNRDVFYAYLLTVQQAIWRHRKVFCFVLFCFFYKFTYYMFRGCWWQFERSF